MTRRRKAPRPGQIDVVRLAASFSRLPRTTQLFVGALLAIVAVIAAVVYLGDLRQRTSNREPVVTSTTQAARHADSPNLLLGNPSAATADPAHRDNYLVVRPAYALAYNNTRGTANWVSWRIVRSDFGDSPRELTFPPDPLLPPGFKKIEHRDYSGSGFDRGHLCPKADRGGDSDQSDSTFYMTNIIPQAPDLNQKAWNNLENYTRDLVGKHRQRVYVIAGPAGRGGIGSNGKATSIAGGKVVVPAECWKVIVAIPDTGSTLDDPVKILSSARVIAVVMPNDQSKASDDWSQFRTTPAEIERKTSLRFFDRLQPDVADVLRQKLDRETIRPPQPYQGVNNVG